MSIDLRGYPISLKDTMFREESQHHLFVHNQLLCNTVINFNLNLKINGHERIADWGIKLLDNPKIVNEPLLETVNKNYVATKRINQPSPHDGIFLIASRYAVIELGQALYGAFRNKIIAIEQKPDWFQGTGRSKLESLINKSHPSKAEMAKISSYIRSEGSQYEALLGLAHIIPFYVARINNNRVINQQISKLSRLY